MENLFPLFVALLFGVILLFDLFIHRHKKIRRSFFAWIFLCLLAVGFSVSAVSGIGKLIAEHSRSKPGMYLAYRYLESGSPDRARMAAENDGSLSGEQRGLVEVLLAAAEGDYPSLYFSSTQLLAEGISNGEQQSCVEQLQAAAGAYLRQEDSENELPAYSEDGENGVQVPKEITALIRRCFEAEDIRETRELEDYYYLDSQVRSDAPSIDAAAVEELCRKYENSQEILKLAVRYSVQQGDYETAEKRARALLDLEDSAENYVIYTDVIAEKVFSGEGGSAGDPEKEKLLDEAAECEKGAQKYEEGDRRRESLLNEAEELREEASRVDLYRAVNLLEAKKPLFRDKSGLFDTQIAKLYLAAGDRGRAGEKIYDVLEHVDALSEDSPVKESLMDVADAYHQTSAEEESPVLKSSVREFVKAQSQDVVAVEDGTINGKMADYMVSVLKYDKLGIFISRVDTAGYPEITAYLNVNGQREGRWGMAGEFYADDFEVTDTQYKIDRFQMSADAGKAGTDIALVLDVSESMSGEILEDAKAAAQACVEAMDPDHEQIAVVTYAEEAKTQVARTSSRDPLIYGLRQSSGEGGSADISAGIEEGLNALSGEGAGTKAVLLLRAGQGGGTEAVNAAVSRAVREQTAVYTVGLGEDGEEELRDIAEQTGGKYVMADNSTELEDIFLNLQRYIVNRYVLTYTAEENADADSRYLTASIPAYQVSSEKAYSISGGSAEDTAAETGGIYPASEKQPLIISAAPGAVTVEEAASGLTVTVKGSGFQEGMHVNIGNLELSEVKVEDETTLTGTLKGNLSTGAYGIRAQYPDGRIGTRNHALYVFRAGTGSGVRIGGTVIRADRIGQISEDTFVASGNVLINEFIHFDADLEIRAEDLPETAVLASGQTTYLGNSGRVSGSGKLYISYARADGETQNYAGRALDGKDFVIRDGPAVLVIQGMQAELEGESELTLPQIAKVTAGAASIGPDGIKIPVKELDLSGIADSVQEELEDLTAGPEEKAARDAVKNGDSGTASKEEKNSRFRSADRSESLEVAVRQENIAVDGEISVHGENTLNFGCISFAPSGIKLDTLEDSREYWKLSGSLDLSALGIDDAESRAVEASIFSEYGSFDTLEADTASDMLPVPGFCLKKMHLKAEADQTEPSLKGTVSADLSLFQDLDLLLPEEMIKWGEMGSLNGKITLNVREPSFRITAGLKLLEQEIAGASLEIRSSGFSAEGQTQLDLEMMGAELEGSADLHFGISGKQVDADIALDGSADCNLLDFHGQGSLSLHAAARFDGTLFSVSITQDEEEHRFWFDDSGELILDHKLYFS